jgi:hypothetical protein
MKLASPSSAILSAVIFNALIIVVLIPLALKGVRYRAVGAGALLRRNLLIYGLGGLIVPFIGIKVIDLAPARFHRRVTGSRAAAEPGAGNGRALRHGRPLGGGGGAGDGRRPHGPGWMAAGPQGPRASSA